MRSARDMDIDLDTLAIEKREEPRCWGYPALATGQQQGCVCVYCRCVYQSRYKHKRKGRSVVTQLLGSNLCILLYSDFRACFLCFA